jgi:hypothetical protein
MLEFDYWHKMLPGVSFKIFITVVQEIFYEKNSCFPLSISVIPLSDDQLGSTFS